jgi:uncharacterized protein (TIGR02117 family)
MRIVKRVLLGFVALAGLVLLLAIGGMLIPGFPVFAVPEGEEESRQILLVANTIHTDIAIPIDAETLSTLDFLLGTTLPISHPDARWLLIGWGGRAFYLETPTLADIKPGPLFRALTLDSSVMHVDVLGEINPADPSVTALSVTPSGYRNMLETIAASFSREDGLVQPIDGYAFGLTDRFFEAEGPFNAVIGCNVWTSRMLRSAGVRTGLWNPIPPSLTASVRLFNAVPEAAGR